jgi:hypothetical protein
MIELLIFIVICCWVVIGAARWWVRTRPRVGWSPPARSAGTLRLRRVVRLALGKAAPEDRSVIERRLAPSRCR